MSLPRPSVATPRRILIIQKGKFGDVTLTTALADDLHRAFPDARVDFGVGAAAAPLLAHHPAIAECVIIDAAPAWRLAPAIRARRYDWVVDVQGSARTALLTRWSGAPVRIGWDVRFRRAAYTHRLTRDRPPEYAADERRRLLALAGVPTGDTLPRLALTAEERDAGERAMQAAGAPAGRPRIGLLLATGAPRRDWPVEHFAALVPLLRGANLAPVAFDAPGGEIMLAALRARVPDLPVLPRMPLRGFLGALAACRALVSGDTGPAHMADALGVARVTIFELTAPEQWISPRARAIALASPRAVPQREAHRRRELAAADAYPADVTPARVLEAVRTLVPA